MKILILSLILALTSTAEARPKYEGESTHITVSDKTDPDVYEQWFSHYTEYREIHEPLVFLDIKTDLKNIRGIAVYDLNAEDGLCGYRQRHTLGSMWFSPAMTSEHIQMRIPVPCIADGLVHIRVHMGAGDGETHYKTETFDQARLGKYLKAEKKPDTSLPIKIPK